MFPNVRYWIRILISQNKISLLISKCVSEISLLLGYGAKTVVFDMWRSSANAFGRSAISVPPAANSASRTRSRVKQSNPKRYRPASAQSFHRYERPTEGKFTFTYRMHHLGVGGSFTRCVKTPDRTVNEQYWHRPHLYFGFLLAQAEGSP